ncbi:hypothetical protein ACA097_10135 [Pseudomonas sp. QL9]|uniref:MFS transporter n=1 Tax=Pseudomonas knackmussii (strain DSM 6978 / CCUG 54928 / LMG 23759 / B13) TaxID=1301098 RepID=A0A024HBJ4_PSEKB|nr:hypothetical protein [Pseudomonas knackmussii]CDF81882.1 hypothetical protein PKB_0504 [Pseudomonas knackmussii B13]
MATEGVFDWLGQTVGKIIRFLVEFLSGFLGMIWGAMDAFLHGMAKAIGMDVSIFSFVLLFVGLLLLYSGVRALLRRSIFGGLILTFLGLIVMSWLIH